MRIHRLVLIAVIVGLSAVVVRAATDADRVASKATSVDSPAASVIPSGDCCAEADQTNYPVAPLSEGGNNCPSKTVPDGSEQTFDSRTGRLEIAFYDVGYGHSRSFILDLRDPACFDHRATRRALFGEIALQLQTDSSEEGFWASCDRARDAIRRGSVKLGDDTFDLRIAQPYLDEVCSSR